VLGGTAKGELITAKGVCWGLKRNPIFTPSSFTNEGPGEGVFTTLVRKLQRGTRYHVRAYARNIAGISYGKNKTFKTKQADSQET
jgi:hypothetical protein